MTAWTADGPIVLTVGDRINRTEAASEVVVKLHDASVSMVALCWVDNTGITRVKAVPLSRFERAAGWGIGMSPVFDVFVVDDSITTSKHIGGPGGDLRLIPDLDRVTALGAQHGWAFAPVDRFTQEGRNYPGCQRTFARKMVDLAADKGLNAQLSFEVEWAVGTEGSAPNGESKFIPACEGPAYGMTRIIELSDYARRSSARSSKKASSSSSSTPSTPPGRWRSRSRRTTRSGPPTTACSCARRSGPCRKPTACRPRSPHRSSPVTSATAGTCTLACGANGRTC